MDYNGHILENTKRYAFSYKQTQGYYPVVRSINKLPVYMQKAQWQHTCGLWANGYFQKAIDNYNKEGITFNAFRSMACGYQKETIEYLDAENITCYIRTEHCQRLLDALRVEPEW